MSKLQCGSRLARPCCVVERGERSHAGCTVYVVLPQRAARRTARKYNHKPDAMQLFFSLRVKAQSAVSVKPQDAPARPADLDTWTLTRRLGARVDLSQGPSPDALRLGQESIIIHGSNFSGRKTADESNTSWEILSPSQFLEEPLAGLEFSMSRTDAHKWSGSMSLLEACEDRYIPYCARPQ